MIWHRIRGVNKELTCVVIVSVMTVCFLSFRSGCLWLMNNLSDSVFLKRSWAGEVLVPHPTPSLNIEW